MEVSWLHALRKSRDNDDIIFVIRINYVNEQMRKGSRERQTASKAYMNNEVLLCLFCPHESKHLRKLNSFKYCHQIKFYPFYSSWIRSRFQELRPHFKGS